MFKQTLALITTLSLETISPRRSERAMHNFWKSNVKLNQRVRTVNLLRNLVKKECGTNQVMYAATSLSKSCRRRDQSQRKFMSAMMKEKINDALFEEARVKRQLGYWRAEYYACIKKNSLIDCMFHEQMKSHLESLWDEGTLKNKNKIDHLIQKWKSPVKASATTEAPNLRNVKYTDKDLGDVIVSDKNISSVSYGGVKVTENMESVLTMNPKIMLYGKIDSWDIETEVEKGFTKCRYSLMSKELEGDDDDEEEAVDVLNLEKRTLNYGRQIATDLPTVQSLKMPKKTNFEAEQNMSTLKSKLVAATKEYVDKRCDSKGFPESNLTKQERAGIKEIKKKVKNKEVFVKQSDKSGKLTIDSLSNYDAAISEHTKNDKKIDVKQVEQIENKLNDNLRILNRIFSVGCQTSRKNNEDRVRLASISSNSSIPVVDGVRKDHKKVPAGQEDVGPPVRPICYSNESPNFRISHFLSKIITNYTEAVQDHHSVKSSEEMRASWEKYNLETPPENKKRCHVLSMDVHALYPSMSVEQCKLAVMELIINSELVLENFDWWEAAKYVMVMYSPEEIEEHGLTDVIPKRTKKSRVKLTVNCLKKVDDSEWIRGASPTSAQIKTLIGLVVCAGVEVTFTNHVYLKGDDIWLQMFGAPIGLELSCAIHHPVMMRYDRLFLIQVKEAGLNMWSYDRYVDDTDEIAEARSSEDTTEDVAKELQTIANGVMPGIRMEIDIPSNHDDQCLPILDMAVWLDDDGNLMYKHYQKPMATNLVISERSAHPNSCKRSVHIAEILRRISNTSRDLPWDEYVVPVLSEYMRRMKQAGYNQEYRQHVLEHALNIYQARIRDSDDGVKPLNRPRGFQKIQRRKEKMEKKKSWSTKGGYIAPIIIPATPNSELAKILRTIADQEALPNMRFKIVEKGGRRLENVLSKPNPTASDQCVRAETCVSCQQGGETNCQRSNVVYRYSCEEPDCKHVYIGESSNNLYTRSKSHYQKSVSNNKRTREGSFIAKHQEEFHNNRPPNMKVKVVKCFKDALSRQLTEAVHIFKTEEEGNFKLMNSKSEWRQPSLIEVRSEVVRREVGR